MNSDLDKENFLVDEPILLSEEGWRDLEIMIDEAELKPRPKLEKLINSNSIYG